MDQDWNTSVINLQELIQISRGDNGRMLRYLQQFQELIPDRVEILKESLKAGERKKIRQLLHQMSPQLQFFGIPNITQPIRRLELEYSTMPMEEMQALVNKILVQLNLAIKDINSIMKTNF